MIATVERATKMFSNNGMHTLYTLSILELAIESDKKTHLLEELETKVMDRYGNVHTNSASCLPRIEELGIRIKEIWDKVYPVNVFNGISNDIGVIDALNIRNLLTKISVQDQKIIQLKNKYTYLRWSVII